MNIDVTIVLIYLALILFLGIANRAKIANFINYSNIQGKARNSTLLLVSTIFVSSVGGGTTFGIAEKAFSGDISYTYGLILAMPVDILIAIYLVPQISKHYGAESVGDIMSKYYGLTGRFIAGMTSVVVSVGFLAAQISVSGYIFQYILKINYIQGVILSYGIIIVYTTVGGLQSILFTNFVQFIAMLVAIPVVTLCGINKIGLSEFIRELPQDKIFFFNGDNFASDLFLNTITAMLGFYVMNLYPTFIQRTLINDNPKMISKALYVKSGIYALFLILITINGLIAYNLHPEQESNMAIPYLIDQVIPPGLQGLAIVGLLAAVMSTADSDLNITSISLVKDILSPIFRIKNQQKLLRLARIMNILIGSFSIFIALRFNNVIDLIIFITGFWGPVILIPLLFAFFNITISRTMLVASGFCGITSFFLWEYQQHISVKLKAVFIGTMVSLFVFLISLLLKKYKIITSS